MRVGVLTGGGDCPGLNAVMRAVVRPDMTRAKADILLHHLADACDYLAGRGLPPGFRRRLNGWVLPALAAWAKTNSEPFLRAAAHPDAGVTIRIRLAAVPGLDQVGLPATLPRGSSARGGAGSAGGTPTITISVVPGRGRR